MAPENEIIKEISMLISCSLEGEISDKQFVRLEELLKSSLKARKYYYQMLSMHASLQEANNIILLRDEKQRADDFEILNDLLAKENCAPSIELPDAKNSACDIIAVENQSDKSSNKIKKGLHKFRVYFSIAAVFIFAVMLINTVLQPVEVASVSKSLAANITSEQQLLDGTRLAVGKDSYRLNSGYLELTYDCGAIIVLEAPSTFYLTGGKSIKLTTGSLYLKAWDEYAKGFTVITPNSNIVDLGTEFGVKVGYSGISDVHMTIGKASIVSHSGASSSGPHILTAGKASRVGYKGIVEDIEIDSNQFVRSFDNKRGVIWRGESISLADFISGGNGRGDGKKLAAINPTDGAMIPWSIDDAEDRYGTGGYNLITDSDYIDGVFIPDGGDGPIDVSSKGHKWNCPDTTAFYKYNIASSVRMINDPADIADIVDVNSPAFDVDQAVYSDVLLDASASGRYPVHIMTPNVLAKATPASQVSSVFMHANLGMTFDLDNIRSVYPGAKINTFKSTFGVAEKYMQYEAISDTEMKVDMWILVDGEIRCSARELDATDIFEIDFELNDSDRYLTLVVTDNGDKNGAAWDWGVFSDPRLEMVSVESK